MRSDATLRRWYRRYNEKYFGGRLPRHMEVRWADDVMEDFDLGARGTYTKIMGIAWSGVDRPGEDRPKIYLNPMLRPFWPQIKMTLLHEMAHHAVGHSVDHGAPFQAEIDRLYAAGAFRKLI